MVHRLRIRANPPKPLKGRSRRLCEPDAPLAGMLRISEVLVCCLAAASVGSSYAFTPSSPFLGSRKFSADFHSNSCLWRPFPLIYIPGRVCLCVDGDIDGVGPSFQLPEAPHVSETEYPWDLLSRKRVFPFAMELLPRCECLPFRSFPFMISVHPLLAHVCQVFAVILYVLCTTDPLHAMLGLLLCSIRNYRLAAGTHNKYVTHAIW